MMLFGLEQIVVYIVLQIIYGKFITQKNSELPNNNIWEIVIDGEGKKWIATKRGIITILDDQWVLFNKTNTPLKTNTIKSLVYDDYDQIWVCGDKAVVSFDGEYWKKHRISNKKTIVTSLFIDDFDNKWLCTMKNVIVYNGDGVEFKSNIIAQNSVVVSK
jgi:streptogramin lyase